MWTKLTKRMKIISDSISDRLSLFFFVLFLPFIQGQQCQCFCVPASVPAIVTLYSLLFSAICPAMNHPPILRLLQSAKNSSRGWGLRANLTSHV